jgi:hypothetical protein
MGLGVNVILGAEQRCRPNGSVSCQNWKQVIDVASCPYVSKGRERNWENVPTSNCVYRIEASSLSLMVDCRCKFTQNM